MSQFQTQHKVVIRSDMDHEDSILEESACREAEWQQRSASLELELRTIQLVCISLYSNVNTLVFTGIGEK